MAPEAPVSLSAAVRKLLALSWPIVLARASQSVIGFSDALMSAPLGESELAAVTTGSLNAFITMILPIGTVFILQSFASQLRGRGELVTVRRYAYYGLAIAAAAGVIVACLVPLIPVALLPFRYEAAVRGHIETYLAIRLLSVAPAVATEALGNWYGGLGNTRPAMVAGLTAMVVNVFLNYLLIEPRWGLPGYGVSGAAWASTLATVVGSLVVLVPFLRGYRTPHQRGAVGFDWAELGRVLRFGLPNGVNWFLEFAAFIVFINVMVAHLGTAALAAFNVVMQLNSVAFMPAFGLASAGAILVGEAIGRSAFGEVRRFVRITLGLAAVWMVSAGLVYFLAPEALIRPFTSAEAAAGDFARLGALMLGFSAFWQLFDAVGITLSETLRAAGDTTWCMWVRIGLAWFVFMPSAWLVVVVQNAGVPAMMLTLIAYMFLLSSSFALRFGSGKWRDIDLIGRREPVV